MAAKKYQQNIVAVPSTKAQDPEVVAPAVRFWGHQLNNINFSINCQYVTQPFLMGAKPHSHDVDQIFCFFGGNLADMWDFDAEIDMTLGEEGEIYTIKQASLVHVPKGLVHCPINFKRIDKPVLFMEIFLGPKYNIYPAAR